MSSTGTLIRDVTDNQTKWLSILQTDINTIFGEIVRLTMSYELSQLRTGKKSNADIDTKTSVMIVAIYAKLAH